MPSKNRAFIKNRRVHKAAIFTMCPILGQGSWQGVVTICAIKIGRCFLLSSFSTLYQRDAQ